MKGSVLAIAASSLLGTVAAGSVHERRHAHEYFHNLRRDATLALAPDNATCGCTTYVTTFYGEPTLIQPAVANTTTVFSTSYSTVHMTVSPVSASSTGSSQSPASSSAAVATYNTPSSPPQPQASSSQSATRSSAYYAPPPPSSSVAEASSYSTPAVPTSSIPTASSPSALAASPSSASPSAFPSAPSVPGTSGSQWCMTYSPYTEAGACKEPDDIKVDIANMAAKGFSSVRLYSTDCGGLSAVGAAAATHKLKLVLGVYISPSGISAAAEQVTDITTWASGDYTAVEMIVVGNEAIFNNYADASSLASFISSTKSTLRAAGYTGPVTTTEPINIMQNSTSILCPVVDVLAANIHPFFNPSVSASSAGIFVADALTELATLCGDTREAYNLETGWPHGGQANGEAVPGMEEQRMAIEAIRGVAGGKSAFFSFVDDLWKHPGDLNVEQSWGCSQLFT